VCSFPRSAPRVEDLRATIPRRIGPVRRGVGATVFAGDSSSGTGARCCAITVHQGVIAARRDRGRPCACSISVVVTADPRGARRGRHRRPRRPGCRSGARAWAARRAGSVATPFRSGSFSLVTMFRSRARGRSGSPCVRCGRSSASGDPWCRCRTPSWQAAWLGALVRCAAPPVSHPPDTLRQFTHHGLEVVSESRFSARRHRSPREQPRPRALPAARAARRKGVRTNGWLADLASPSPRRRFPGRPRERLRTGRNRHGACSPPRPRPRRLGA
jgi:hypothetical protein